MYLWTTLYTAGGGQHADHPDEAAEWSRPPAATTTHLREGEANWNAVLPSTAAAAAPPAGAPRPPRKTPTVVLEDALAWLRQGKCDTREGHRNRKQAAVLLLLALWVQARMERAWRGGLAQPDGAAA